MEHNHIAADKPGSPLSQSLCPYFSIPMSKQIAQSSSQAGSQSGRQAGRQAVYCILSQPTLHPSVHMSLSLSLSMLSNQPGTGGRRRLTLPYPPHLQAAALTGPYM